MFWAKLRGYDSILRIVWAKMSIKPVKNRNRRLAFAELTDKTEAYDNSEVAAIDTGLVLARLGVRAQCALPYLSCLA